MGERIRNYTVFDLEMTGLSAENNRIIEIGALHVRDGKMADTMVTLVNPHVPISPIVVRMTKITDAMLQHGKEEDVAVPELIDFIGSDIIVGHSVAYDFRFIKQWAVEHKVPLELWSCDTLMLAQKLLPEEQSKRLSALCKYFKVPRIHAHRALDDAIETWQVFEILSDMAQKEGQMQLLDPVLLKGTQQSLASNRQKQRLKDYMKTHGIHDQVSWDTLTRSQASRRMDHYRARYGKNDIKYNRKG